MWDSDFVQYMMIAMEVTIKELIEKGFTMITLAGVTLDHMKASHRFLNPAKLCRLVHHDFLRYSAN